MSRTCNVVLQVEIKPSFNMLELLCFFVVAFSHFAETKMHFQLFYNCKIYDNENLIYVKT